MGSGTSGRRCPRQRRPERRPVARRRDQPRGGSEVPELEGGGAGGGASMRRATPPTASRAWARGGHAARAPTSRDGGAADTHSLPAPCGGLAVAPLWHTRRGCVRAHPCMAGQGGGGGRAGAPTAVGVPRVAAALGADWQHGRCKDSGWQHGRQRGGGCAVPPRSALGSASTHCPRALNTAVRTAMARLRITHAPTTRRNAAGALSRGQATAHGRRGGGASTSSRCHLCHCVHRGRCRGRCRRYRRYRRCCRCSRRRRGPDAVPWCAPERCVGAIPPRRFPWRRAQQLTHCRETRRAAVGHR